MGLRKIDLMHKLYGRLDGQRCADCSNLLNKEWAGSYFKCSVYGNSNAESTDWRKKYVACGMFNVDGKENYGRCLTDNTPKEIVVFENQIDLFGA